ncbi:XRE family transcriptional regulator [Fibrella sp. ES10-3-2-2]|nr:hypothetical protein A6C57_06935 [Fibrella sp. ES10-3-2-2]
MGSNQMALFSPQAHEYLRRVRSRMVDVARTARGLTQEQLAVATGMQQAMINKLINNKIGITDEHIQKIAEATGFPTSFFSEDVNILPDHIVYYRKYKCLSSTELTKTQYNLHIQRHRIKKLLASVDLPNNLVKLEPNYQLSPEQIANHIRLKWNIPRGPINDMTRYLEAAGVIVLLTDQEVKNFDGLVLPDDDGLPVICINRNSPPDRQRYNLAHELGHLIMHTNDYFPSAEDDFEGEANRFAAEFLMPEKDIVPYFQKDLPITQLTSLKAHWKVSMAAIVRRAYDTGVILKSRYTSLNVQLSKLGYKKKEPLCGLRPETPYLWQQLLMLHRTKLDYSDEELADLLRMTPAEFKDLNLLYSSPFTVHKTESQPTEQATRPANIFRKA